MSVDVKERLMAGRKEEWWGDWQGYAMVDLTGLRMGVRTVAM